MCHNSRQPKNLNPKESVAFNPKEILITAKFTTALICCFSERGKPHVEAFQGDVLQYTVYTPVGERIINQSISELLEHENPNSWLEKFMRLVVGSLMMISHAWSIDHENTESVGI